MDTYVLSSFVKQLKDNGYPEESLIVNYKEGRLKMDSLKILVIDPLTRYQMCSFQFEPKREPAKASETSAVPNAEVKKEPPRPAEKGKNNGLFHWPMSKNSTRRIERTKTALLTFNVSMQHKGAANDKVTFRLKNANHDEPEIRIDQLPPLYVLTNASRAATKFEHNEDTDKKVFCFKSLCYFVAACLVALCVVNLTGWHVFSDREFIFIAAAVMLAILPHTKVIKMFGMEIERDDETAAKNGVTQAALVGAAAALSLKKQVEDKTNEASATSDH